MAFCLLLLGVPFSVMAAPAPRPTAAPNLNRPLFLGNVRPHAEGAIAAGGRYIFWLDASSPSENAALLGYDAGAHMQFSVSPATQAHRQKGDLVTDGRTVAWRDSPTEANAQEFIRGYDTGTGTEYSPMQDEKQRVIGWFAVDGDKLYYTTREQAEGLDNELLVYSWTTHQTGLIATARRGFYLVRVRAGNGSVAWAENDTRDLTRLYLAPGGKPTAATLVSSAQIGLPDFAISGGRLLWTQKGLHIYTISTRKKQVLGTGWGDHLSANGTLAAWRKPAADTLPSNPVFGPWFSGPLTANILDLRTGRIRSRTLPGRGEYGDYVALVGSSALAYVHGDIINELYLQPLP